MTFWNTKNSTTSTTMMSNHFIAGFLPEGVFLHSYPGEVDLNPEQR